MLVVGLTGGIATGKSTVSNLLKTRHNVPIVDADLIARKVVEPGSSCLSQIVKVFGPDILMPSPEPTTSAAASGSENGGNGEGETGNGHRARQQQQQRPQLVLDRAKLGAIVFSDEEKRKKLNKIVHPAVRKEMFWQVVRCWLRGEKLCVLDVPLLIEGGLWKWVGKVVVVYCSSEIQLQRLMKRDSSTRTAASSRLTSQLPISSKLQYADIVIDNSGSPNELESQIDNLVKRLEREAGDDDESGWGWWWGWRLSWWLPPVGLFRAASCLAWRAWKRSRKTPRQRREERSQRERSGSASPRMGVSAGS